MGEMKFTIIEVRKETAAKAVFFNLLLEFGEGLACVIPGWKIFDGRIYPPSKGAGKGYYSVVLASEEFCRRLQKVVEAAQIEGVEIDHDGYASAKWGQAGLKAMFQDPEAAVVTWQKYRRGN